MGIRQRSMTSRPNGERVELGGSASHIAAGLRMSLFTVLLLATIAMAFRAHLYLGLSELAAILGASLYMARTARETSAAPRRIR